jgi:hypothetical protein
MPWLRHLAILFAFLAAFVRPALASAFTPASPETRVGGFEVAAQLLAGELGAASREQHQGIGATYDENASGYRFAAGGAGAITRVVNASGGSIKQAITAANQAGLNQSQAVQALTRVVEASGRSVGGVVDVAGGARVLTGVVQGAGQPIVHISASGTATFGSANVTFAIDAAGKLVPRVTNIVLP